MKVNDIMPSLFQRSAWIALRAWLTAFCSLEIRGLKNLANLRSNMIIASNHTSELDPLLIVACLPFFSRHLPLFFTSREKDFYAASGWRQIVYGGTFFRMMGAYPVYVGHKNYEHALKTHLELARSGKNICIFPSGKKILQGESAPAKGGVSFLAHKADIPIVPVLIRGVENLTFRDSLSGNRKISVVFGTPLAIKDIFKNPEGIILNEGQNDYATAAATLMEKITQLV